MKILQNRSYPDNISCNIGFEKPLNQEQISRLNWVIEQQTQKQRNTFYKFFRDNMTVKEISAEDGVTKSCVRSRMSVLFDYVRRNVKGYEVDFIRIWNQQEIYPELEQQIKVLCTQVYEFITRDDRLTENVTQWCKQPRCWELAKNQDWNILPVFTRTLVEAEQIRSEENTAKETRKVESEIDALKFIMGAGQEYWEKVYSWGASRKLLSDMDSSILRLVINIGVTGRIPSVKQAKVVLKTRERLISEGMPLQF